MTQNTADELNQKAEESITYDQYADGQWQKVTGSLPDELALHVFINGTEFATIMCTPEKLNNLVLGFLRSEGLVAGPDDVTYMRVCIPDATAEVRLNHEVTLPDKRVITTGCGGGAVFESTGDIPPVTSALHLSPVQVLQAMRALQHPDDTKTADGRVRKGTHVAALSNGREIIVRAEDIGRHNALDKIWGECMLNDIPITDTLLVSTGRISSEMLIKSGKMSIPVVASINSATKRAVDLGNKLGITIIGYVSGTRMSVYTHPERMVTSG